MEVPLPDGKRNRDNHAQGARSDRLMPTRRALMNGLVIATIGSAIPMHVDQHLDPLVRTTEEREEESIITGPILLDSRFWRVVGAKGDLMPCPSCGQSHTLNGSPIYTIGCHPAAMPIGVASGLELFALTADAHPVGILLPNCPGARFAPHLHAPTDYQWV